eukprot:gene25139-30675_t
MKTQAEAVTVAPGQDLHIRHRPNATEKTANTSPAEPGVTEAASWHIERRKKILKEFPEIASLEKPYPITILWCIVVVVTLWATTFLCGYIGKWEATAILAFLVGTPLDRAVFSLSHELVNMVIESRKKGNYLSPATGLSVQKTYAHLVVSKVLGMFAGELVMKPLMIARKLTGANILTPPDPFPKGAPKFLVDDIIQEAAGLLTLYVACQLLSLSFLHGWLFCFLTKAYDELAVHPFAAYFLITHMSVFGEDSCQPTMSTYGSSLISAVYFNVNYHVEHHDFPRVPWVHLPKITAIADKWYSDLKSETFLSAYLRLLRPGSGDTWVYGCHAPEVRKA